MSTDYKGFRIWNLEFQAMAEGADGVTKELDDSSNPTGRLLSSDSRYYTEDDIGLACHLRDFLDPMTESSKNGVGWSLDTELYSYLYNLVQSGDETYTTFINDNQSIYDPALNPTGETTVKLAKTRYVRAMFFKHTLGYKAMIGLSLYAMDASSVLSSYRETNYSTKVDPGFNRYHIFRAAPSNSSYVPTHGGIFISVIPPKGQADSDYRFHAEKNVTDSGFFPPTATPVVPMMHAFYSSSSSSQNNYNGCSWLKLGTSTAHNAGNNAGVLAGTNMKLSLLLDSKGCVGVSYKYTATSNTTYLNPLILIGPLYKEKIYPDDSLSTSKLCIVTRNIRTNYNNTSVTSCNNAAWRSASGSSYYNNCYHGSASSDPDYVFSFSADASNIRRDLVYTAYPALNSGVYLSYRYAKSGYTTIGFIDNDIIVWTNNSGLVPGQLYNDGQWCYIGATNNDFILANNMTSSTSDYLYPSIRWDSAFNGTKTFS